MPQMRTISPSISWRPNVCGLIIMLRNSPLNIQRSHPITHRLPQLAELDFPCNLLSNWGLMSFTEIPRLPLAKSSFPLTPPLPFFLNTAS